MANFITADVSAERSTDNRGWVLTNRYSNWYLTNEELAALGAWVQKTNIGPLLPEIFPGLVVKPRDRYNRLTVKDVVFDANTFLMRVRFEQEGNDTWLVDFWDVFEPIQNGVE